MGKTRGSLIVAAVDSAEAHGSALDRYDLAILRELQTDARREDAIPAECLLQGEDPARWLISQGWARAKPDGPFGAEGEAAAAAQRGIYGQPPR